MHEKVVAARCDWGWGIKDWGSVALLQQNKWRKIVFLSSADDVYFEGGVELQQQFEAASIEVLKPAAFLPGNFNKAVLSDIRRSSIRIVLVLTYDAQKLASHAQFEGMMNECWMGNVYSAIGCKMCPVVDEVNGDAWLSSFMWSCTSGSELRDLAMVKLMSDEAVCADACEVHGP